MLRLLSGPFRNRAHQKVRENDGLLYPEKKQYWSYVRKKQDKTLAYYANAKLTEKETEEISNEERIQRFQKIMNERYGKKES